MRALRLTTGLTSIHFGIKASHGKALVFVLYLKSDTAFKE